jgi:hypothetical protein
MTEEPNDMATTITFHDRGRDATSQPRGLVRKIIAGAVPFDGGMGLACLAVPTRFAGWLSVGTGTVRATGLVFGVAAAVGAWTLARPSLDVRWIVAANVGFAFWCVAAIGFAGPDAVGAAILAVSAVAAAGTAVVERRLGARG